MPSSAAVLKNAPLLGLKARTKSTFDLSFRSRSDAPMVFSAGQSGKIDEERDFLLSIDGGSRKENVEVGIEPAERSTLYVERGHRRRCESMMLDR